MELSDRTDWERTLARAVGSSNQAALQQLLTYLGDPPDLMRVPVGFWDTAGAELLIAIRPVLEEIYLTQAEAMMSVVPVGVDWALVNAAAARWVRVYGGQLIKEITETSRQAVGDAVGDFFEDQLTMGELTGRLERIFGPVRAEMIAATETTRAAVEGERETVSELEKMGIKFIEIWQTENDEMVCPICGPLHGKAEGDGWTKADGPPAHPQCRCWTNHEVQL